MPDPPANDPLTIAHVISAPTAGGAEIYVKDLALALHDRGQRPVIVCIASAVEAGRSAESEIRFVAELDAAGIPWQIIGPQCRRNPALGAWRVARAVRTHRADVYHSHTKPGILFGLLLRIPRVHTHHSSIAKMPRWAYALLSPLVDAYVGISERCGEALAGFSGRTVTTIRNAVSFERMRPWPGRPRVAPARLECLAVGRLRAPKNYALLIDALALLPPRVRDRVHVAIAGQCLAQPRRALDARIRAAGLENVVTILGDRADVPALLQRAQLFLISSAWEGLPIALLEATVSGLPFIATDVGGCAEVAAAAGNGVIVPPGDPAAFAAALAALVDDPDRLTAMSRSALANAGQFSISAAAEAHLALYRCLMKRTLCA
ncbi:glycosyltransferase [Sphingomonas sp.]|uniref:glycosyltransferase n=1 Tax=Sphingomonas sp. TaxID=28214 RepID=UPI00286D7175|nr:glycosyltransferase [Sphingomonas sp.]